jgi:hypothetical protein
MRQKAYIFSLLIGFVIVTISPIFDSVVVTNYNQVEHHRLGFPLPILNNIQL